MKANQIPTGIFVDEKEVIAIELSNSKETYVKLFNYGTIINKFIVKNAQGDDQDIVLGFDDIGGYLTEDYLANYAYFGAVVGRYANRIKNGEFEVDGISYQVPQNNGNDCLHGGNKGFDRKVWDIIEVTQEPNPSVTFHYYSVDGEEGFPGDLAVQLRFTLTENNELILTYQADTDEATPINLTHHSYFNLSAEEDDVKSHFHQMNASNWLAQDDNFVVTGKLIPVGGTHHDFRKGKTISEGWDEVNGYDQTYALDKTYGDLSFVSKTSSESSGLSLSVYSTEPIAHFYTAKYNQVENGKGGKSYGEFSGFCVETQHAPNSVNIPEFPSTVLQPEEIYHQTTIYKVEVKS
ncbi:MAG: galactose mutarotase [Flavobacteriales bacterium]|nr:MAG: galactose mutarotase [Flavobacteriales bacterium]